MTTPTPDKLPPSGRDELATLAAPSASQAVDDLAFLPLESSHPSQLSEAVGESRSFLSSDIWERGRAADRVGEMARGDKDVLTYLLELGASPEPLVRRCTARALGVVADKDLRAEEQLVFLLDDAEPLVASAAAWALLSMLCRLDKEPLWLSLGQNDLCNLAENLSWHSDNLKSERIQIALDNALRSGDPLIGLVASIGRRGQQ